MECDTRYAVYHREAGVENGTACRGAFRVSFRSCAYQLTANAPAKKQLRGGNRKRDPALEEMRGVADPCMRIPNKSPALAGLFLMIAAISVRGGGPSPLLRRDRRVASTQSMRRSQTGFPAASECIQLGTQQDVMTPSEFHGGGR
jgi:hypothetical protein